MTKNTSIWTAPVGVLGKSKIEVHFSTILIMACFCLELMLDDVKVPFIILALAGFVLSYILHEVGHMVTSPAAVQFKLIRFYSFGALHVTSLTTAETEQVNPNLERKLFLSTLGGPLTNLAAMLLSYQLYIMLLPISNPLALSVLTISEFNLFLAIVNLLPLLPFDFGQFIKRRLESEIGQYAKYLQLSLIGGWLLMAYAIFNNNLIIAIVAGQAVLTLIQESFLSKAKKTLGNSSVREAMIQLDQVLVLSQAMTISAAADLTSKSFQPIFPVQQRDELIGIVSKDDILQAYASGLEDTIASIVKPEHLTGQLSDSLVDVIKRLEEFGAKALFVMQNDKPVGVLFKEKLTEYLMVSSIKNRNSELGDF